MASSSAPERRVGGVAASSAARTGGSLTRKPALAKSSAPNVMGWVGSGTRGQPANPALQSDGRVGRYAPSRVRR